MAPRLTSIHTFSEVSLGAMGGWRHGRGVGRLGIVV